jgi:hypothetical protein
MPEFGMARIALGALAAAGLWGQQYAPVGPPPGSVPPHIGMVLMPELDPVEPPASLDQLIRSADLIVDATVAGSEATVALDINVIPDLETDSVLSISQTFYNAFSSKRAIAPQVLLAQTGGKWQDWDIEPKGAPLVQPGQRYIFFLEQDCRETPPRTRSLPRYDAVGVWAGLLTVVDGRVVFLPSAAPILHESDGTVVTTFVAALKSRIGGRP